MDRERDWLVPLAFFVALEWLVAFSIYNWIDYPSTPNYWRAAKTVVNFGTFLLFGFFIFHFVRLAWARSTAPAQAMAALARDNATRFVAIAVGLLVLSVHMTSYNWAKSMLPFASPFWADAALADIDEALFGKPAWRFAYDWVGFAAEPIRWAYVAWHFLHMIVLCSLVCFRPSARKHQLILTYVLMWAIGGVTAYAVSSAGPLFYGPLGLGDRFADLVSKAHLGTIPNSAQYLWFNYQQTYALPGGGISAFPSLHVAVATWVALVFRHWIAWAYVAVIFVGSFLLGWHYFVDAPAGLAVTLIAYRLAPLFQRDSLARLFATRAESAAAA